MRAEWNDEQMYEFCTSMAMVLEGGLSPQECLEVILSGDIQTEIKKDLEVLLSDINWEVFMQV